MVDIVSVIIPAHNEAAFIPDLLTSIESSLPVEKEIIVVDNGSSDETAEICKRKDVRLVTLPTRSYPAFARNRGAEAAQGDLFAFLDADVVVTPQWGATVCEYAAATGASEPFVKGAPCLISRKGSWIERIWFEPLSYRETDYINGANMLVSRVAHERIGGFDEALETNEDIEYCKDAARLGIQTGFDRRLVTHHEGFPKTVGGFIRRERWHGSGDCKTMARFVTSKIALASVLFLVGHFAIILPFVLGSKFVGLACSGLAVIAVVVMGSQLLRFGFSLTRRFTGQFFLSYMYFVGRVLALVDCVLLRATLRGRR